MAWGFDTGNAKRAQYIREGGGGEVTENYTFQTGSESLPFVGSLNCTFWGGKHPYMREPMWLPGRRAERHEDMRRDRQPQPMIVVVWLLLQPLVAWPRLLGGMPNLSGTEQNGCFAAAY